MAYTKRFNKWWKYSQAHQDKTKIVDDWLRFASKTVALRGSTDQQRLVYTIHNRFKNSTYKQIAKKQAFKVWMIIHRKQQNFKAERARIRQLLDYLEGRAKTTKPNIVRKRKRTRKIITGGSDVSKSVSV